MWPFRRKPKWDEGPWQPVRANMTTTADSWIFEKSSELGRYLLRTEKLLQEGLGKIQGNMNRLRTAERELEAGRPESLEMTIRLRDRIDSLEGQLVELAASTGHGRIFRVKAGADLSVHPDKVRPTGPELIHIDPEEGFPLRNQGNARYLLAARNDGLHLRLSVCAPIKIWPNRGYFDHSVGVEVWEDLRGVKWNGAH